MAADVSQITSRLSTVAAAALLFAACDAVQLPTDDGPAPTPPEVSEETQADSTVQPAGSERTGAPAVWTLSDEDTTIHLFGTVHVLKPEMTWRTPDFDALVSTVDTIYFEADVTSDEAQAAIAPLVMQEGLYGASGGSLTATLDDEEEREVEEALDLLGLEMAAIDPMKPWMAGVQLASAQVAAAGYDPNSGVEMVLSGIAAEQGIEIGYFETAVEQLGFFVNLPEGDQVDFLVQSAIDIEDNPGLLDEIVEDWASGDVSGIADLLAEPSALGSDAVYETLIVERNTNWTPKIEALLEEPGVKMVAVGAAHLAGDDSVVQMLRDSGYTVSGP